MDEPVHWLKAKYTEQKTVGRYRSSHNDGRRYKRKKNGKTETNNVVLVLSPTGKRRFERG